MAKKSRDITFTYPFILTTLIYGMIGLTFLRHRSEITRISRDIVYTGMKILASRYPKYFPKLYFTQRGSLPHSKEIEDALFRLGGVLETSDFRYRYISFNESELEHVETKLNEWLSSRDKEIIEKLAEEFYQIVRNFILHPKN
jgi:hypothetical protein